MTRKRVVERLVTEIAVDRSDQKQGFKESIKDTKAWAKQVDDVGKAANESTFTLEALRKSSRNLGHQFQDVAVQIQGGQDILTVFAQQGPQMLSSFSSTGAVYGAVLAIGALIASFFVPSLFDSKDAVDELEKSIDSLQSVIEETDTGVLQFTKKFDDLASLGKSAKGAAIREAMEDAKDAIDSATMASVELVDGLSPNDLGGRFSRLSNFVQVYKRDLESGKITLQEFVETQNKLFTETEDLSAKYRDVRSQLEEYALQSLQAEKILKALKGETEDLSSTVNKQQESIDRLIERLEIQSAAMLETGKSADFYRAQQMGATEEELKRIESLSELIDAQKEAELGAKALAEEERDAAKDLATIVQSTGLTQIDKIRKTYDERIQIVKDSLAILGKEERDFADTISTIEFEKNLKVQQSALSSQQTILTSTGKYFNQIQRLTEEGSAEQKAFFLLSQSIDAASAFIDGLRSAAATRLAYAELAAITANPAFIGIGEIAAKGQVAAGTITSGLIAGKTIASFLGGGKTPSGPRSGGLDGQGGFLTVLHPDEKVTDLKAAGPHEITAIEVNIYGQHAVAPVVSSRKELNRIIIDVQTEQNSNPSSRPRQALHATSNVTPKGGLR